jgi:hypothetical protein
VFLAFEPAREMMPVVKVTVTQDRWPLADCIGAGSLCRAALQRATVVELIFCFTTGEHSGTQVEQETEGENIEKRRKMKPGSSGRNYRLADSSRLAFFTVSA